MKKFALDTRTDAPPAKPTIDIRLGEVLPDMELGTDALLPSGRCVDRTITSIEWADQAAKELLYDILGNPGLALAAHRELTEDEANYFMECCEREAPD